LAQKYWCKILAQNVDEIVSLGSISTMFYEQLLLKKIPKAQKDSDDLTVFFHFWVLRS